MFEHVRGIAAIGFLCWVLIPVPAGASPAKPVLGLVDPSGFEDALARGNRAAVQAALVSANANPAVVALSQALLDGRVSEAISLAATCIEGAFAGGAVPAALRCAEIRARLLRSRGELSDWASQILWVQDEGLPALQAFLNLEEEGSLPDEVARLPLDAMSRLDRADMELIPPETRIPVDRHETVSGLWVPTVEIQINGVSIRAQVDTGSTNLMVMRPDVAERTALIPVADGLRPIRGPSAITQPSGTSDSLHVASSVEVGKARFRNVGVVVSEQTRNLPYDAVLGLPALAHFGFVGLSAEELVLASNTPTTCEKPTQLAHAVGDNGIQLLLSARIDGVEQKAFLDTGFNGTLRIEYPLTNSLQHDWTPLDEAVVLTIEGPVRLQAVHRPFAIDIGDARIVDEEALAVRGPLSGVPLWLGAGVLDHFDLELRFEEGSACLVPSANPGIDPDVDVEGPTSS